MLLEVVKRNLRVLAKLDQMAVWIAHVATPFPSMGVERLSEKDPAKRCDDRRAFSRLRRRGQSQYKRESSHGPSPNRSSR
jgi:hypothetical protein